MLIPRVRTQSKSKYENDALSITAMNANAALSQGRDLDKVCNCLLVPASEGSPDEVCYQVQMKLDKVQQSVAVNEREYRNYVGVLKDTTVYV